jgi:hypothetical protein
MRRQASECAIYCLLVMTVKITISTPTLIPIGRASKDCRRSHGRGGRNRAHPTTRNTVPVPAVPVPAVPVPAGPVPASPHQII